MQDVAQQVLSIELKAKLHLAAARDCEQLYLMELAEAYSGEEVSDELLRLLAPSAATLLANAREVDACLETLRHATFLPPPKPEAGGARSPAS